MPRRLPILLAAAMAIAGALVACGSGPRVEPLAAPPPTAAAPAEYPGLHRVVAFADGLYSCAAPEGEAGFASLAALGARTVISVDGAQPDTALARRHGLRYVHLPIGYDRVPPERILALARATRDLPGAVFIHCHHGQHRSAAAAGTTAVALGRATPEQAAARMRVSGTAAAYAGLHRSVAGATPAGPAIDTASAEFPEHAETTGMVDTMVAIDEDMELLAATATAGWRVPEDHPDLVPAALAGRVADHLRDLGKDERAQREPPDFAAALAASAASAASLERLLVEGVPAAEVSPAFDALERSCRDCHVRFRN